MLYRLPKRSHEGSKLVTVTLVSIYVIIALLQFINDSNTSSAGEPKNYNKAIYDMKDATPSFGIASINY
jgi:hypothetical protein